MGHLIAMGRSPAHSDFAITDPPAAPVVSDDAADGRGERRALRWLLGATLVLFVALAALVGVGLHIPTGG
jgi:hypothetical protein